MIGIVILNYNTYDDTLLCIESIRKHTKVPYKIYLVDNQSPDGSYDRLLKIYSKDKDVMLIKAKSNDGYSAGNNIGIKHALKDNVEGVLIVNSDIVFKNDILTIISEYSKQNEDVGIIGPKVYLENGKIQHLARQNYTFKNYLLSKKPFKFIDINGYMKKVTNQEYSYDENLKFSGSVSGCCMFLTRNYIETCGMLDENTFLYYEEGILAAKAKKHSIMTSIVPTAEVIHKSSKSIGNKNSAFSRYHRYYSSMYMMRRYIGINNFELLIISIVNLVPFIMKSLIDKEYKKYLSLFIKQINSLFRIDKKV